jgi:hypothetical protein
MATHASCAIHIITANPLFGDGEHAMSLNERLGQRLNSHVTILCGPTTAVQPVNGCQ